MAKANPPPHQRLPDSIQANRDLADVLERIIFDMFLLWQKLGGGSDWMQEALQGLYEFDDLPVIDVKQEIKDEFKVTDSDYTTSFSETVICTAALTVFLNPEPDDREKAKVLITDGDVTINGNGKVINKKDSQTVIYKNLSTVAAVDCIYIIELDEWFIV